MNMELREEEGKIGAVTMVLIASGIGIVPI